jgi:outer membrane immunogenic protein
MGNNRTRLPASLGAGAAFVGVLALAAQAQASDLNAAAASEARGAETTPDWTGFYVGGHAGGAWATAGAVKGSFVSPAPPNSYEVVRGPLWRGAELLGGLHGGYNWSYEKVVFGVEADVSFSEHIDYLASLRGRLGLAADNWLFYGTAGAASSGGSRKRSGFVAGGGVEIKLDSKVSVGVEALRYSLDSGVDDGSGAPDPRSESLSDVTVVRGRLTLRLGNEPAPLK